MEPIIDINWTGIIQALAILTFMVGIGLLVVKVAVAYAKKNWEKE